MPASTPKFKLSSAVATPEDLQALVLELRTYAKWTAHVAVRQKALHHKGHSGTTSKDHATAQPVLTPAAKAMIHDLTDRTPLSPDSLAEFITEIETLGAQAPRLHITLAAPPHGTLKKSLVAWCRDNIASDVLVEFSFNRILLGGMVVRSGSHIHDWSTRRLILEHRNDFPHTFHQLAGPQQAPQPDGQVADDAMYTAATQNLETSVPASDEPEPGPSAERGA